MAPRHNDPARTREQILIRATEEFARLGFEGGRVDRIAARCRLSKNMLYYYFQSKERLFVAVLERMYETMRNQQKDLALRTSDPVVALEQLIRHTFMAMQSDPSVIRLMNEENKHRGKYLKKSHRVRELYEPLLETIAFILDRGSKDGVFRTGLDPVTVYLTFSSLCYHYLSNQYTLEVALGRDMESDAAHARWLNHVVEVVMLHCLTSVQTLPSRKIA
ncbi:MAG TPA: TetR family transcriptional regulator [Pseudolabrys sp.]|uniref:TetR family transcriptional regulator n=1 Tax=Pseudolabrys sp. TaxID=1960880 RepID=UPI002DDD1D8B|nr:TetR family transcriptional regulator [Pseudolabrys sp.]HEV2627660.1 TetR family transcriptional regulator [Pseudolabrys sp.]